MAHYVISDLHGEDYRFHAMLEQISFSDEDTMYVLGDVIDRFPSIPLLKEILSRKNIVMLLGNHEYMCLQYYAPDADALAIRRWDRNGNLPTKTALDAMPPAEREELLKRLAALPDHLRVTVAEKRFYLVHGFPGSSTRERVWNRPTRDTVSPLLGDALLIVGHTPVTYLAVCSEQEEAEYAARMAQEGEHARIFHGNGFLDIDCCCGYPQFTARRLACLRLEDGAEYYA